MDFKQLESFLSIARHKNFSKAAKELYITQPTISNHIQILEKELGTALFNRSNRQIELTPAGEIFYDYTLQIINLKETASFQLGKYVGKLEGNLNINASSVPEQYILPLLLKKMNQQFPEIKYHIQHMDSDEIIQGILEKKFDYGFVGTKIKDPNLEYHPLLQDELVFIAPNDMHFKEKNITVELLKGIPLIFREDGSGTKKLLAQELKKKNIQFKELNIIIHSNSSETIKNMVSAGVGCSIISKLAIDKELKFNLFKSYYIQELPLKRNFYFVNGKNRILSPLELHFIDFIKLQFQIHTNI